MCRYFPFFILTSSKVIMQHSIITFPVVCCITTNYIPSLLPLSIASRYCQQSTWINHIFIRLNILRCTSQWMHFTALTGGKVERQSCLHHRRNVEVTWVRSPQETPLAGARLHWGADTWRGWTIVTYVLMCTFTDSKYILYLRMRWLSFR